jgi:hypothetical protein
MDKWLSGSGSGWDYGSGFWMRIRIFFRIQACQNCLQRPKKEKVKKFNFGKFPVGLEASPEVRLFFEGF